MSTCTPKSVARVGLYETQAMHRYHTHRQSLRARRLNLHPPGMM
ncbi:hypothetical protein [Epibacterium ulvae]|nr:hypothetical protein [Epibacterium ulvae]